MDYFTRNNLEALQGIMPSEKSHSQDVRITEIILVSYGCQNKWLKTIESCVSLFWRSESEIKVLAGLAPSGGSGDKRLSLSSWCARYPWHSSAFRHLTPVPASVFTLPCPLCLCMFLLQGLLRGSNSGICLQEAVVNTGTESREIPDSAPEGWQIPDSWDFNYSCKDPFLNSGHIQRFWGLEFGHIFFGGHIQPLQKQETD